MTESLLSKVSKNLNDTIITDAWLTGQTGEIVDIKGDGVYRFIDYMNDGELRRKHLTEESMLSCPVVALGFVGYWLHRRDNSGIKEIFEGYYALRMKEYEKLHESDDDSWDKDLKKEFVCRHHIPSEKKLIKASEAIYAYVSESDQKKIKSIASNYLKFARAKRKELYPPKYPANKRIEETFFDAYRMGGAAYECVEWMRIEYDLPHMGPHWRITDKTEKERLSGEWKEHHDVYIPGYVSEEFEDFDDSVLNYADGGLMDEINENLKSCLSYEDRARYIVSLLQPFKEFADAFDPKTRIDERKRAIIDTQKDMKSWEGVADDAVDERTGEPIEPQKQIIACKESIEKYEKDIKYWKNVQNKFFMFAQHGLTGQFQPDENQDMCLYLGRWWSLMVTFSRRLAAVALTYGIRLMDVQEHCGIYLIWHFMITDYVDYKFVTSIDHAKNLLDKIDRNKQEGSKEIFFNANEEFDAWNYISDLIRSAKERIVIIDGYIDDRVLKLLTKRNAKVDVKIYSKDTTSLRDDIKKFNKQYPSIELYQFPQKVHDRFLIIDEDVYHLGASIKDMGRSLCAVTKMEEKPQAIIDKVSRSPMA